MGGGGGGIPSGRTGQKPRPIKKRPTIPALILAPMVTWETFISLISKPPPRMATANKIAPKMNDIACSVIARLNAHRHPFDHQIILPQSVNDDGPPNQLYIFRAVACIGRSGPQHPTV